MGSLVNRTLRLLAAVLILFSMSYAQAAGTAKPQSGGITRDQADQILNELRQIRKLLETEQGSGAIAAELRLLRQAMERQQAAAPAAAPQGQPSQPPQATSAKVNVSGLQVLGRKDAPLTLVEFSDYQCPFCRAFHTGAFEQIKKEWIDTGKLRLISWDLPLEFHSNAAKAAQAAHCAGEQNKFWEMRNLLIANAAQLEADAILGYARQVPQLDVERFKACIGSTKYSAEIKKAADVANAQGISGTPSFLLGKTNGDQLDGTIIVGAQPYAAFEAQLKQYGQ
jgi:protein-disulfide isomerase